MFEKEPDMRLIKSNQMAGKARLAAVVSWKIRGLQRSGRRQNFFDLGRGHSGFRSMPNMEHMDSISPNSENNAIASVPAAEYKLPQFVAKLSVFARLGAAFGELRQGIDLDLNGVEPALR